MAKKRRTKDVKLELSDKQRGAAIAHLHFLGDSSQPADYTRTGR
jgi:hypothetical protein